MTFHVGQKVVCVDATFHGHDSPLSKGAIYSVSWVGTHPRAATGPDGITRNRLVAVALLGVSNAHDRECGSHFSACRFRPAVSQSIQLFRDIAQGVSDGKPIVPDDQPIRIPAPIEGWTVESLPADILRRAGA